MVGLRILEDVPLPVRLVRNVLPSVDQMLKQCNAASP